MKCNNLFFLWFNYSHHICKAFTKSLNLSFESWKNILIRILVNMKEITLNAKHAAVFGKLFTGLRMSGSKRFVTAFRVGTRVWIVEIFAVTVNLQKPNLWKIFCIYLQYSDFFWIENTTLFLMDQFGGEYSLVSNQTLPGY